MYRLLLSISCVGLLGCGNSNQKEIVDWAKESVEWEDQPDGSRLISFATPYFYGDQVQYDSVGGKGKGFITDITLAQDGSVIYTVQDEERKEDWGQAVYQGGVYPDEITLIARGIPMAEPVDARNGEKQAGDERSP